MVPLEEIEYGVNGDLIMTYPKPYLIYLRGTINPSHSLAASSDWLSFPVSSSRFRETWGVPKIGGRGTYKGVSRGYIGVYKGGYIGM